MPRFIVKVEKHGSQVRVTIPRMLVASLGFEAVAYALCRVVDGKSVIITPFIDEGMLREAISRDRGVEDPGTEKP